MMQATIARRRTTQKSFAASTGLHSLLFLAILLFAGRGAVESIQQEELTHIAYIEAKYGEDIANKVKMKTRKGLPNAPKGPGIETRSAMKPEVPAPTPALSPRPSLVADVSAPKLEHKDPTFAELERERLQSRRSTIAESPGLAPESVQRDAALADAGGTPKLSSRVSGSPKLPEAGRALVSRGKASIDQGGPNVPGRVTGSGGGEIAELSPSAPALKSKGLGGGTTQGYVAPSGSLSDRGSGQADLDVGGTPAPGGGSSGSSGRRTILDYGSGGGGGGGLDGRAGTLREAPAAPAPNSAKAVEQKISEAAPTQMNGKGTNMTISGQIEGRQVLRSVPPEYSKQARENGWEGVVAVHFTVLADGRVKDNVYYEQTSAHRDLNQAAMAAIKQFQFAPLPSGQSAVEQWGVITIVFRLN